MIADKWSLKIGGSTSSRPYALSGSPAPDVQAFAFWGGDFYIFVAGDVWRFRPSDGSTLQIAHTDDVVVAAGVSTCAPLQ
jgi:hypothetical protein